jgi:spermidine synthase
MLGLGGGFIPNLFKKYLKNHQLTVIEVDPLIAELASIYFGFEPGENVKLVINDGFEFIAKAQNGSYDQIWLDAFNGDYIPDHMRSADFLAMIKLKLVSEGLAVQNLHQTAWLQYRFQLEDTVRVFNKAPRLFAGARSGNTFSMSLNSDTVELPTTTVGLLTKIKAFQPKVGPYDLAEEAKKLIFKKGLESQLT